MPRNGSDVYSAPAGTTATSGTTIESAKYNAFVSDLEALANEARPVVAGGTGATTASGARAALGAQAQGDVLDDLNTLGAPSSDGEFIVATGAGAFAYESGATVRASLGLVIGTDVQAYDADTLKADTADVLTAGFAATPYNAGTQSSGTYTPDEANGNLQYAVNGGAHTLAPPTNNGTIIVQYTNNASAGSITTTGFTLVDGDSFDTTDGNDFLCFIVKHNNFSSLTVKALQ